MFRKLIQDDIYKKLISNHKFSESIRYVQCLNIIKHERVQTIFTKSKFSIYTKKQKNKKQVEFTLVKLINPENESKF